MRVKYPSLETRWVSRIHKWVPQVPMIFIGSAFYGGLYCPPRSEEYVFEGRSINLTEGLIVVCEDQKRNDELIAHEWRHHHQHCSGVVYDGIGWPPDLEDSYDNNIINYFSQSDCELDALLFSSRFVVTETTLYWLELLEREGVVMYTNKKWYGWL